MQLVGKKLVQDWVRHVGKGYQLAIVREIEFWPYYQMVYAQTRIHPGKEDPLNSLGS